MTPLRQRMIEDMQVRNLSQHTIDCYVRQVALFARYFKRSPELLGHDEIRAYQLHLVHERKLNWGNSNRGLSRVRRLAGRQDGQVRPLPRLLELPELQLHKKPAGVKKRRGAAPDGEKSEPRRRR